MKHLFLTLFFALMIGFGTKAQYIYSYTGLTNPAWHNENREIELNINVTLDSIYNKGGTHYGIYFTYNIVLRHNGKDITSQMPIVKEGNPNNFFNNLRLNIGCGEDNTDVGLIPLINVMGYSGFGLADNNQAFVGITNPTIENLWCNKVTFEIGYPGLNAKQSIENSTLPIELLSFNAKANSQQVDLNWSTASELNNDYFTIERSADGMSWETVQTVEGSGNSTRVLNYSWTDYSPYAGISYYRLTQTDFDGASEMFHIISVENKNVLELQAYPNPAIITSTLKGVNEQFALRIFNSMGADVTGRVNISTLGEETKLDMNQLPIGMYYVRNGEKSIQLVKQ